MVGHIYKELKKHIPFTVFGALSGIVLMVFFRSTSASLSHRIFYVLHPLHVILSALVTSSMYGLYSGRGNKKVKGGKKMILLLLIGWSGAVGIATLSDSLIPYLGEVLLDMPGRAAHIGFIDKWWLINPLAIAGVAIAFFRPSTKFPHSAHVLLSTWASLFHIMMAGGEKINFVSYFIIFIFLFTAVWVPCCISDIVFPLLFVKDNKQEKK